MRTKSRLTRQVLATASAAVISASVLLAPSASAATAPHAATQAAIDTLRTQDDSPGAGVVVREGDSMWSLSSGTRAVNQNLPFGPDHKARIGSLTKTFTSAIVLQLVAANQVDLDAPVETYLPGVVKGNGYDGTKISVRQLLNHTSGIADYLSLDVLLNPANQLRTHTLAEVASWGLAQPPMFAPGKGQRYSDTNYILAGMIIEKVTGNPYDQELRSRIITPLGLTNTFLPTPGDKVMPPGHVRGYIRKTVLGMHFFVDLTDFIEPSMGLSGGGMVSSGADTSRFYQALLTGRVVPAAQLAEMLKPNGVPGASFPDYGLGVDRFPLPCGGSAWGHYGRWPGYVAYSAATTDGRSAFVVVNTLDSIVGSGGSGGPGPAEPGVALATALCDKN
ncbi:serine hydrolase domain-containing protein [Kutzneria viridogrisea]|uniref:Beta-lactamase-related domain-containing protein n=1 Tax=Kutzneria albida DSM 43870 TaxID=1449976 RepID=W5WHT3_9PSEU|nr:hypothetical protein KALB_6773 [Kutzneria albida DSM 43870]